MHLRKRIGLLISAKLRGRRRAHDLDQAALRRADKMEALLEQLDGRLWRAAGRRSQLQSHMQKVEEKARLWDQRADEALLAGDEEAAREAIRHKLAYSKIAAELAASLARRSVAAQELQTGADKLESQLNRGQAKAQDAGQSGEESVTELESLRERMSRVWSEDEIEDELQDIKKRLSSGMKKETKLAT